MGIDVIIQFIAIVAFIAGLAGVALVVTNVSRNRPVGGGVTLAIGGFLVGIIFMVISSGLLIVGPTQTAVVFNNLTGELESPRGPGLHVIIPGIQQATIYRTSRQEYTMVGRMGEGARAGTDDAIAARSIDGQEISVDVTLIFAIDPQNVNPVHRNWSDATQGYIEGLIRPIVRAVVRDVFATAAAEEIFGGARTDLQDEIQSRIAAQLGPEGFTVVDFLLREINFSTDFIQAIEQRQVAELSRDRAATEADTARIQAQGLANARIEQARGEAEAIRVQAAAEADALRYVSEQIAANPNLIQYLYVTNMSDNVSIALVPSNTPFLFDPSSFMQLGADFVAPEVPALATPEPDGQ